MKKILYLFLFAGLFFGFRMPAAHAQGTPISQIRPEVRAQLVAQLNQMATILIQLRDQYAAQYAARQNQPQNLRARQMTLETTNREALAQGLGILRETLSMLEARVRSNVMTPQERVRTNAMLGALRQNLLTVRTSLVGQPRATLAERTPAPRVSRETATAAPQVQSQRMPTQSEPANVSPVAEAPATPQSENAEVASAGSTVGRSVNPWPYIVGAIILIGAGVWFWRGRVSSSEVKPA